MINFYYAFAVERSDTGLVVEAKNEDEATEIAQTISELYYSNRKVHILSAGGESSYYKAYEEVSFFKWVITKNK
jgi:hypothetical protein